MSTNFFLLVNESGIPMLYEGEKATIAANEEQVTIFAEKNNALSAARITDCRIKRIMSIDDVVDIFKEFDKNNWASCLEDELSEEFDIPANVMGKHVKYVEVELPATRQVLNISNHSLYGFMMTLVLSDETGGVLKEMTVYTAVRQERLASLIDDFYRSY